MKKRKIFALLLSFVMLFSCFSMPVTAKAAEDIITMTAVSSVYDMVPGETVHFKIPVKLSSYNYMIDNNTIIAMVTSEDGIFTTTEAKLTREGATDNSQIGLSAVVTTDVEFDLTLKDSVKIGLYTAEIQFKFDGTEWDYYSSTGTAITGASVPFTIRVMQEKSPAQLTVDNFSYEESMAAVGATFDLDFDIKNEGEIKAYNTYVTVEYGATGMIPNYTMESIKLGDIAAGESKTQKLSVRVLPTAEEGLKTLTVRFDYKDVDGKEYSVSRNLYVNLLASSTAPEDNAKLTAQAAILNAEVNMSTDYNLVIQLENVGPKTARNIKVIIPDNGGVGASTGILPKYPAEGISVENIKPHQTGSVEIPLSITKSAAAGLQELTVQVTYEDSEGRSLATSVKTYITIMPQEDAEAVTNDVVITNVTQSPEQPVAGDILTLTFNVANNGNKDITNLVLYGEDLSSNGFEPLTADVKHHVGNLAQGTSKEVTMYFKLGSQITAGMNQLKLAASYVDANGTTQKETTTIYILNVKQVSVEQVKNSILIHSISQTPENPVVGENVTVSFTVVNNGSKGITDLKFKGTGLGSSNFEPISSEIYTLIGDVAAGESKKVSMTFKVGSDIPEGFNTLSLEYTYTDGNNDVQTETTSFYVLNVKNASSSKPKLIVSDFSTSMEELRAGSTFDFTFALQNTHATKAAKNIKVTVVQADGVFATTGGSNSFYIDEIAPGAVYENTLNMKVKSDTPTGAYEISIKVEYEYEDMAQADANAGGVSDENKIRLQAVENARPAVQNLSVGYYWDTPTVNQSTTLSFDFYNMGKSTLDNVYVTLSGDFAFESGTMQIIGSVMAGSSSYQEISIVPTMEGMCNGILTVHFEDSNGDEVTKDFELPETYVQGEYVYDSSWDDMIWDIPTGGDVVEAKEPLMPVWAYVVALAAALLLGTVITRAIVIKCHKAKLLKEEDI